MKITKKECYGAMDSNMAIDFPYDCNKCKDKEECFKQTIENIRQSLIERGMLEELEDIPECVE